MSLVIKQRQSEPVMLAIIFLPFEETALQLEIPYPGIGQITSTLALQALLRITPSLARHSEYRAVPIPTPPEQLHCTVFGIGRSFAVLQQSANLSFQMQDLIRGLRRDVDQLKAEKLIVQADMYNLKTRVMTDNRDCVLFAVSRYLDRRLNGHDPVFRPTEGTPRIHDRLSAAAVNQSSEYANLCSRSAFASEVFTSDSITAFQDAVNVDRRHMHCHPEYTLEILLGELLILERVLGREWRGRRDICPDVVALRFFLTALGGPLARQLLAKLREAGNKDKDYLDEVQLERLEKYFA